MILSFLIVLLADPSGPQPVPIEPVRRVMAAVTRAAEKEKRINSDEQADFLIREAARAALLEPDSARVFLLALGLALDDSQVLRKNPLFRAWVTQIESDEQRQKRLRVLGQPTLCGRRDWMQHFSVSATLTAHLGSEAAERLGILKESLDARPGGSGFSFTDIAADYAGILLAEHLLADKGKARLTSIAERFKGTDYMPEVRDLEDGLSQERFKQKYGAVDDARFRKTCEAIRMRVRKSAGFQWAE